MDVYVVVYAGRELPMLRIPVRKKNVRRKRNLHLLQTMGMLCFIVTFAQKTIEE